MVFLFHKSILLIRDFGKMDFLMDKDKKYGKMGHIILVIFFKVKNLVKEKFLGMMEIIIRDNLNKTKLTVMVNIIGKMVEYFRDNGKIIR